MFSKEASTTFELQRGGVQDHTSYTAEREEEEEGGNIIIKKKRKEKKKKILYYILICCCCVYTTKQYQCRLQPRIDY